MVCGTGLYSRKCCAIFCCCHLENESGLVLNFNRWGINDHSLFHQRFHFAEVHFPRGKEKLLQSFVFNGKMPYSFVSCIK